MLYTFDMSGENTVGERIAHARKYGVNGRKTQLEVANALGVTPQAVSGWERDEAIPELDKFQRLAKFLGTSIMWLVEGTDGKVLDRYMDQITDEAKKRPRTQPTGELFGPRDFPIYSASQGGDGFTIIHTDVMEYVRRPAVLEGVPEAYGVLVVGESMVPSYRPGDMALIHPRRPPTRQTDVVLYKTDPRTGDTESTIKHLIGFTDTSWKLEQFNPAKTFSENRAKWPICHQVVGRYNSRR